MRWCQCHFLRIYSKLGDGVKSPSLEKLAAAIFLTGEISFQYKKRLPRLQCQTFLQTIVVPKLLTSIGLIDVNVPNGILCACLDCAGETVFGK